MKLSSSLSLILFVLLFAVGCGGETTPSEPDSNSNNLEKITPEEESIAEEIPFDADAIYLERMYATSNGITGPEYLLDGNPETNWNAVPGAGPNEGVMLYFEEPIEVGSILLRSASSGNSIKEVECFINGSNIGNFNLDTEKDLEGEKVQSLFVRITKVKGEEELEFGDYPLSKIKKYPENTQVALAEIEFKDPSGNPLKVRPLHLEPGTVTATSVLEPATAYNPDFLFDSNLEFGWAEGAADEGVGEKIDFVFDRAIRIEKIKVWNGYQRSVRHFERNARAKEVAFAPLGGNGEGFELPDEQGGSIIELDNPMEGNEFEFRINSFYPGESYKDLVLSEFRFFDGKQWFGLGGNGVAQRKSDLGKEIGGTFLADIVGKSFYEYQDWEIDGDVTYSLNLRTNGSFVLYRDRKEYENGQEKSSVIREVADGNWSIESLDSKNQVAKVKIFGKLNRIMEKEYWYKGRTSTDWTKIFSEILTITPTMIKGQKMIDEMHLTVPISEESDAHGSVEPDEFGGNWDKGFPGNEILAEFQVGLEV